jgi:glycosyltransferase involved in cell wall biosynthesis
MADPLPRISVVIAVRNGATTVERALQSVLEQTHPRVELVVMDGASTDGTVAILERYGQRITYWRSEPDSGIYDAWNKALDHVTGDWICFLGADDRFTSPDVLEWLAGPLQVAFPAYRVAYAQGRLIDGNGRVRETLGSPWERVRDAFRSGMALPHPATFQHRELFVTRGRFDASFRIAGDYELLLRELRDGDALFISGVMATDIGTGGISDHPRSRVRRLSEAERARRMHGLTRTPEWRSPAVLRARIRWAIWRLLGPNAENRAATTYRAVVDRVRRSESRGL